MWPVCRSVRCSRDPLPQTSKSAATSTNSLPLTPAVPVGRATGCGAVFGHQSRNPRVGTGRSRSMRTTFLQDSRTPPATLAKPVRGPPAPQLGAAGAGFEQQEVRADLGFPYLGEADDLALEMMRRIVDGRAWA
jgi:hypothetical protein